MLKSTIESTPTTGGFQFTYVVENVGNEPRKLTFHSSQRFDLVARTADGEEVWRWSDGQLFTQAIDTERLRAGEQYQFIATWKPPKPGTYEIRGSLAATDTDAAASMTVEREEPA